MELQTLCRELDALLDHASIRDYPGAANGLQVANTGTLTRVALAVDAHSGTLRLAVEAGADLLIVHHGLFWAPITPLVGPSYSRIKLCLDHNLAVYASHLPLDAHPALGNTTGLCDALGLGHGEPWFESMGTLIGRRFEVNLNRHQLSDRLRQVTGQALLISGGPEIVRSLGVVTGGAGGELASAVAQGIDTFLTGEGPHWTFGLAQDLGVNVLYGGHYATETFGVRALGRWIETRFGLPCTFLDAPSGL